MSDHHLDAIGLKCPLPVLKARRVIRDMQAGETLIIMADDPAAHLDFVHFCEVGGHVMAGHEERADGVSRFVIRKKID